MKNHSNQIDLTLLQTLVKYRSGLLAESYFGQELFGTGQFGSEPFGTRDKYLLKLNYFAKIWLQNRVELNQSL